MTLRNVLLATVLSFGLMASTAYAADKSDLDALNKTSISLTQAIAAAENHHTDSRALDASIDDDSSRSAYEVTVVDKENRFFDVQVDGMTGEILGSREDLDD